MGKAMQAVKRLQQGGLTAMQELRAYADIVQAGAKYAGHGLLFEIASIQQQGLIDNKGNITSRAKTLYR